MPENDQQNNNASNASPTSEIKVNGNVISSDYNLVSLVVYNCINRIAQASFIFLDGDALKADFPLITKPDVLPGETIEISAGYKGVNQLIFKCIVKKHYIKINE